MQAVLLVAGKSSRFYPYNQDIEHKSLVVLVGKTLLEHTIDSLKTLGILDIIIVVGSNSAIPQILSHRKDVVITYVEQSQPLGMGDAILQVKKYLQEKFFVMSPYHMDIIDFAKDMLALQKDDMSVVLVKHDSILDRYGAVTLQGNMVMDIVEKPDLAGASGHRLLAIYLLNKSFIDILEGIPTEEYHFEKALAVCAKKKLVLACITEKPTVSLKYAWDLLAVKNYLLSQIDGQHISPKASIAEDAIITGDVIIEDGVTVFEGVCIKGPAYIGKDTTIGNRAIIRNGVIIENNCLIGSQIEIKNSIIMYNSTTHAGFIGDSVVGHDTKIAGGFITANARLDRQPIVITVNNVKINTALRHFGVIIGNNDNIGIRVSSMPGVIIGNSVIVGPATSIMKNIEDNKKYYTKFQEITEANNEK